MSRAMCIRKQVFYSFKMDNMYVIPPSQYDFNFIYIAIMHIFCSNVKIFCELENAIYINIIHSNKCVKH